MLVNDCDKYAIDVEPCQTKIHGPGFTLKLEDILMGIFFRQLLLSEQCSYI